MSSRRSLVVLSVLALVSIGVVAVDRPHRGAAVHRERRLVPEYDRAAVTGLTIERPGAPTVVIAAADGSLAMTEPHRAGLDETTVDDLLGALEVSDYRRATGRDRAHGLDAPRAVITVRLGSRSVSVMVGARLDAIDRAWVGRSGDARSFLVDGWVVRALDRTAAELRSRRVFLARPDEVTGVEIHDKGVDMVLSGAPLSVHREGPGKVRMDADTASRLLRGLDGLVLERFASAPAGASDDDPEHGLRVRVIGTHPTRELTELGSCPAADTERLVRTSVGTGCVAAGALDDIRRIARDPAASYDRRLVGSQSVETLTIAAGTGQVVLRRWGAGWRFGDGTDASRSAVTALLDALDKPRDEFVEAAADAAVTARVVIGGAGEERQITIVSVPGGVAARRDAEPVALRIDARAAALLSPRALDYREPALLSREPADLVEVVKSQRGRVVAHVVRGDLLDDWRVRTPTGGVPAGTRIRALARAAATLHARRFVAPRAAPVHGFGDGEQVLALQFAQPLAQGNKRLLHRIVIGKQLAAGCYARLDDDPVVFELDREACSALTGRLSK